MLDSSFDFLAGLAMTTIGIAGMCGLAYDASVNRDCLRRRVDLLPLPRTAAAVTGRRGRHLEAAATPTVANPLTACSLKGAQLELARRLAPLRIGPDVIPRVFLALQLLGAAITATGLGVLGFYADFDPTTLVGAAALGGALGWRLPNLAGDHSASQHRRAVARGLPDAIELLVIAVEAGLSLEDALNRITNELHRSQPVIAEELASTSADLRILPSREDALHRLVDRVDLPAMHSVVTTLTQTLRLGTPLAQALRVMAGELRNDMLIRLEEQANRLPVLLTVPMILFILPSLFLIIMGPAALNILDAFQ